MTDKHEHINAAIRAAEMAVWGNSPEVLHPWKREMARALVAELLRGMEPPEWFTTDEDCGFNAALAEIKRRAGIVEGEG